MSAIPSDLTMPPLPRDTLFQRIQPWLVVFSAALFFFFGFMQMNMFNALDPSLFVAYHLKDATKLGELSACYMYANMIFLFPAGILLDHFSPRKLILSAMSVIILCTYLFSMTTTLWQAEVCRFVIGIAGAFCLLSCVRVASRWFLPKQMALVVGLIVTFAMLGGMVAQTPFTKLIEHYGWQKTLYIDALIGCAMLVVMFIFIKDYPKGTESFFKKLHDSLESMGLWPALKLTLTNKQNWLGGIYASLINLPVFVLGSTWGSWYLTQTQGLSQDSASYITSMLFIGLIVGSPIVGWISDRLSRRKMPMIVGAIASILVILGIMYLPNLSFADLLILFFLLGFVISAQIIAYPLVAESNPSILTGEAEGVASVMIMSGGFVIPLFPALLNLEWNHQFTHHIPLYSLANYHLAFLVMPVAFAIALLFACILRDTRCIPYEERAKNDNIDTQTAPPAMEQSNAASAVS